jgi:hypothetical protein
VAQHPDFARRSALRHGQAHRQAAQVQGGEAAWEGGVGHGLPADC